MAPLPPLFDPEAFRRALAAHGPGRGYLFYGPGEFLHRLALAEIKRWYGPERAEVHLGAEVAGQLPKVLAELETPGLFSESKLVVILDAVALKDGADAIQRALAGTGPGTLALSASGGKLADKIRLAFERHGEVVRTREPFERPPPWKPGPPEKGELAGWIVGRARTRDLALAPALAWELASRIGTDLAELDHELDKLKLLCPNGRPDAAAIAALVGQHRGYAPYELADTMLDRDGARAYAQLRATLAVEPDAAAVLLATAGALRGQVGKLLLATGVEGGRRGPSGSDITAALRVAPFQGDRLAALLPRYAGADELAALRHAIFRADRDFKQGLAEPDWLLERLVAAFCPPRAAARGG